MSEIDERPTGSAPAAHSAKLVATIVEEIRTGGGWLRFDRYMQRALYEPGLGYYSAGAVKFGPDGDFTTAPELSPALADALAALFARVLRPLAEPTLLELGAGTGRLADRLLESLSREGVEVARYLILEPSPDLRARQRQQLERWGDRVVWIETLPERPLEGIVFGNEVADALPVVPFVKTQGRCLPLGVGFDGTRLHWQLGSPDAELDAAVVAIEQSLGEPLPDGYRSEVSLLLGPWIGSLADTIARGGLLLIDYGLPVRDYYHPQRAGGTLICHFRHRAHDDPFLAPGLQDITAWVDFSAVAAAGRAAGLQVAGFTTQGQFLLESLVAQGPERVLAMNPAEHSALKTLLLPGEMGERFKLLWLSRDSDAGFVLPGRDYRDWL